MWRFAIQNLVSRPLRSLLALAGLSVAIAGMVGLFSVAEGIDHMVNDTFSRIPGLAIMQAGAASAPPCSVAWYMKLIPMGCRSGCPVR